MVLFHEEDNYSNNRERENAEGRHSLEPQKVHPTCTLSVVVKYDVYMMHCL